MGFGQFLAVELPRPLLSEPLGYLARLLSRLANVFSSIKHHSYHDRRSHLGP